ncbi:STU1 [Candida theae]|uniref:Protein STU1 n=1 Tax=Candida theae TaxID=1198502 RepID=A0AAD5BED8_9ASCO|nr:STU1 [Candida theae]KAI5958077.1 STU1 [Candida theae]
MMSTGPPNSQESLQVMESSASSNEVKLQHMQTLKAHIKRNSIDLSEVPMYLRIIMKGLEFKEHGISNISFNALSYLIKRISAQDRSGEILKQQSFLILPVLINKLGSDNSSVSKKALEDYWLSAPEEVEHAVNEISFTSTNMQIAIESILWMEQIVQNVSVKLNVRFFAPAILRMLSKNQGHEELIDSVRQLFLSYIQHSSSPQVRQYLEFQCKSYNIDKKTTEKILPRSRPSSSRSSSSRSSEKRVATPKIPERDSEVDTVYFSSSLSNLLDKVHYELASSVKPKDVSDGVELHHIFDTFYQCFEGKEGESNWKQRERRIVETRSLLRGNAANAFKEDLVSCLKSFANPMCKGASSLRTTLCTHTCQLIKECAIILKSDFEPCSDLLFPTLMKLCLSTKSITSGNAHMVISALYANLPCNAKLFQRIVQSMDEPNFKPRSFAVTWLQILLLRYALDHSFFNGQYGLAIDTCNKLMIKLLKDANPNVRQVSKECYWCFSRIFPEESEALIGKFDANTIRALERSQRELGVSATTTRKLSTKISAPPLKESTWDRIKDQQQMKVSSRSTSRESNPDSLVASSYNRPKAPRAVPQALKNESNRATPRAASWNASQKDAAGLPERARSRTEVFPKPPVSKEDEVVVRHSASEPPVESSRVFSKDQDPMIDFMSSKSTSDLMEGVSLLKYAIISKEDVSNAHALKSRLRYISEKDPMVLKQLFSSNDYVFKTAAKLFTLDDFVRVCSIIFVEVDQRVYELMTGDIAFNDFFNEQISLLGTVIDSPAIAGSTNFKFLISSYQFKIAKSIFQTFSIALTKVKLTDVQFGELFQEMVRSISVLKGSEAHTNLKQLFCQLYAIDSYKFTQLLDEAEFAMKDEVESIVGIDSTVHLENPLDQSVFELTEVNPGGLKEDYAPKSADDGFTMVVPKLRDETTNNDCNSKCSPLGQIAEMGEDDVVMVDEENDVQMQSSMPIEVDAKISNNTAQDESIMKGTRPFKLMVKGSQEDAISYSDPIVSNIKPHEDLIQDMASIHIENPSSRPLKSQDAVQTMIDKVDPLRARTNKTKKINIYEDYKLPASEPRNERNIETVTFYSQLFGKGLGGDSLAVEQFNNCCDVIASIANVEDKTQSMISVSQSIASLSATSFEFREYFLTTGKHKLTSSLWEYFELGFQYGARPMTTLEVMDGLIILKLLLRYDETMDPNEIFRVMDFTCKLVTNVCNEMFLIWREIVTSIIKYGSHSNSKHDSLKSSIEKMSFGYLMDTTGTSHNLAMTQLCLYFLSSTLIQETEFSEERLCQLDEMLGKFFNCDVAELRHSAIVCYSCILKNSALSSDQKQVMERLKSRYPIAKQRLIEEYSK